MTHYLHFDSTPDTTIMTRIKILLLIMLVGFIIVALPDSDVRLFSISKEHGPSLQDAIRLLLILVAYVLLLIKVWRQKEKVRRYQHTGIFQIGLFVLGLGHGLIIASLLNDYTCWWVYGVILIAAIQVIVFYLALK